METLLHQNPGHENHDDHWCIVSRRNQLPLCVACLIDQLDDSSMTAVHRRFNLSALAGLLSEDGEEVGQLLFEHLRVSQHILDIITDNYTDENCQQLSVQVCVQLVDMLQSEEFYMYMLDKFEHQVQTDGTKVHFVLTTLGKLSTISPVYVVTLILSHEKLLTDLLALHAGRQDNSQPLEDDSLDCSLLFLTIRLFDVDTLPLLPPQVFLLVQRCLLAWLASAQSTDVQINTLALLKKLLSIDCCLWDDSDHQTWSAVLLGFKRVLVRKKEVLVTAAVQCLVILASNPRHAHVIPLVLNSDISEFLFDALYTVNCAQLEAVYKGLHLFAEYDLFYQKCHAVYGLESVLRSLDVALDAQNTAVLVNGFSLLTIMLNRQPQSIPMFVNKTVVELTVAVITKGVRCHSLQVALPAVSAATSFVMDEKFTKDQPAEFLQTVVQAAMSKVGPLLWRGDGVSLLSTLKLTHTHLFDVLLKLLLAAVLSTRNETLTASLAEECNHIISYSSDNFASFSTSTQENVFLLLNKLYEKKAGFTVDVSKESVSSGFVMQILAYKPNFRTNLSLLRSAMAFVVSVFESLVKDDLPQCPSLPEYLQSGLTRLSLKGSLQRTVDEICEEETASALCMILYFAVLNQSDMFLPDVIYTIESFHARNLLPCTPQKPLVTRFLLYFLVWIGANSDETASFTSNPEDVERKVLASARVLPVEMWATPRHEVFLWLFHNTRRADGLGTALLEHWLLHTKGNLPVSGDDSDHAVCALFNNVYFRSVLLGLLASPSEEIAVLTKKLLITLISINTKDSEASLINTVHEEVMMKLHDLFLRQVQPACHTVNNFLELTNTLLQHPQYEPTSTDQNRVLRVIYHGVHYISGLLEAGKEIFYHAVSCLVSFSKTTDEDQDKAVVPMIVQNSGFMKKLENCLQDEDKQLSSAALKLVAWISTTDTDCQIQTPISLSSDFVMKVIKNNARDQDSAPLQILYLCLSGGNAPMNGCVNFHRSSSILQQGHLFTLDQIQLLFCHVQQLVCSENVQTQMCAVQCLLRLMEFGQELDDALGDQLLHHSWNQHLVQFVLSKCITTGMQFHFAQLVEKLWCFEDDEETAKLILMSVLATENSFESLDFLQAIVQKAGVVCRDKELVEKVKEKVEDCLPFSQASL